ncbi:MAG: agmatinase [Pseudomonadota bacterium]
MTPVDADFLPISGLDVPRFAGPATAMRLPMRTPDAPDRAEIGLLGIPYDGGTTNRPGARHGPRALRDASTMIRMVNQATRIAPFHTARVADFGDAAVNLTDVADTLSLIERQVGVLRDGVVTPLIMGGDHLISLPVLRAMAKDGPLGFIHFDAHTDLNDGYFGGTRYTHGTPFRRAVEEGLLDPARMVQIGIRGTTYDGEDRAFAAQNGIRIIPIEEVFARSPAEVIAEARAIAGGGKTYLSFDIDALDPSVAPGTGTPEIGGLSAFDAQTMVRALDGIDIVAADLVEVSPPFDPSGGTAWVGASILFEILCITATACARRAGRESVLCEALAEMPKPRPA